MNEFALIQRELKQLDGRLFLERQISWDQRPVWCVVVDVGGDQVPITILEYRDANGVPIHELSFGIVERMKRMSRDGKKLADKVIGQNRQRVEQAREQARLHWEELGAEFEHKMSPVHSAVLPRSQSLRMSRDKRRARGERL